MQSASYTATPEWEKLRSLVGEKCLTIDHPFTLSTGQRSGFYFDCKKAMLNGECLTLIADAFLKIADEFRPRPSAIGGLTMGADFIVAAVIQRAYESGHTMTSGSIVRKEPKHHGTKRTIENPLGKGTHIMVVDDVITSGASTEIACEEFKRAGYKIAGIVSLVDREAGGSNKLSSKYGCDVRAVFRKQDFPQITAGTTGDYQSPEPIAVSA